MKKRTHRGGFVLSDSLLGLLIVSVATLTFTQAQSVMMQTTHAQSQKVEKLRQEVERTWVNQPKKTKESRLTKESPMKPPVKRDDKNPSEERGGTVLDSSKIKPLKGGEADETSGVYVN